MYETLIVFGDAAAVIKASCDLQSTFDNVPILIAYLKKLFSPDQIKGFDVINAFCR